MRHALCLLAFALPAAQLATEAAACPFCSAEQSTLTEELSTSDAAVIARLVRPAPSLADAPLGPLDADAGMAGFRVVDVLFGDGLAAGETELDALYYGEPDLDASYLIRGVGNPYEWAIPLQLSDIAVDYVKRLRSLPETGSERLAFFKDYLQHEDPMLAQDAYDEFARAPYDDVKALKPNLDRELLLGWIEDPVVSPSRRRLYLTMLGVCGTEEDIPQIEGLLMSDSRRLIPAAEAAAAASFAGGGPLGSVLSIEAIRLDERRKKLGLDAMIACYLTLRGAQGLDLVDQRFLSAEPVNGKLADYSHIYSALMALRFLAEESDIVPVDRVLASARLLLDNGDFADQVIPDLARWQDWSVLERLTDMYVEAGEEGSGVQKYVREPIITYLDVAAEQEGPVADRAKAALASIEPIDPEAVHRARSLRAFGFLGQARPKSDEVSASREPAATDTSPDNDPVLLDDAEADAEADGEADAAASATGVSADGDEMPDPASFAGDNEPAPSNDMDELQDVLPSDAPLPPDEAPPASRAVSREVEPAIDPPPRTLLIAAPTVAGVLCFGLFWMILRSGEA